jgi:acetyltransferase-like isoleucine patch superfamily enzyme
MSFPSTTTLRRILVELSTNRNVPYAVRLAAYRAGGIQVGDATVLCARHRFCMGFRPGSISIGANCYVNQLCWFDAGESTISLGDHVVVAAGVQFQAATHTVGSSSRRAMGGEFGPIVIGDGSWIGSGAIIMPGVTIAPGCVIGAGAVVTKSTESNGLYLGVPAKRTRDLPD